MSDLDTLNAGLRQHLLLFARKAFGYLHPGKTFLYNWHLQALAYQLERVMRGEDKRLVICLPPRCLKTEMVSVILPAFLLGRNPTERIIGISYGQDLATGFSLRTRRIMESAWYRELFPGTVLSADQNTREHFETTQGGCRMATSVTGALTGLGGDLLIIDDPIKADDALSPTRRAAVNEWYDNTASSRLDTPTEGRIIVVLQRFHEEDLAGTLIERKGWARLVLPAIAEQDERIPIGPNKVHVRLKGESIHPAHLPLEFLAQHKEAIGPSAFSAQYQQHPVQAGDEIVKLAWFKRYEEVPQRQHGDLIIQSWDFAFTTSERADYSVCLTFLLSKGVLYLIDVYRKKLEIPDLLRVIPQLAQIRRAEMVIMEAAGASLSITQTLIRRDPLLYKYYGPRKDKELRLARYSHVVKQGQVFLPESAPWLLEFERELQAFPKGRYKDQVDALSQILNYLHDESTRLPSRILLGPEDEDCGEDDDKNPYRFRDAA